ncbi:META domain-containing protein [Roseiflexus sp.]|uniref:META domain-containing protein n=1 Tax=Roseiflexus sp. TaxID=2562120 RepID=UPI00398ACE25
MSIHTLLPLVILGTILASTACGVTGGIDLAGTAWRLVELNGRAPLAIGEDITLRFETQERVGGNSGCNLYSGAYRITGATITFRNLAGTQRACLDPALNTQESEFYQALDAVATFELTGSQFLLKDGSGAVRLRFEQ